MKTKILCLLVLGMAPTVTTAQLGPTVVTIAPPTGLAAKPGETAKATLTVTVASGYHANSDKPNDEFLIPFSLKWNSGPAEVVSVTYPKTQTLKLGFSAKPVSVFTGTFDIVTQFKVPSDAPPGPAVVKGKLRYQACDDRSCLPPKTVEVSLPTTIGK